LKHIHQSYPLVLAVFGLMTPVLEATETHHADARARKPNVIFILADDLGYAELGCYGQKKIHTPCLDRMAAQGMRFTQNYAGAPVCAPSRCCLMTGKHGGHAWVRDNREVQPEGQTPLRANEVTLAQLFHKQGYATAAIGKWGLGFPGSTGDPHQKGFDLFFGYNCQRHAHSHYPTYLWRNDNRVTLAGNDGKTGTQYSHDLFETDALQFIREHRRRPFFLYVPFTIPHVAIQVPPESLAEYQGKWDDPPYDGKKGYLPHPAPRAGYAAMVTRLDRSVGRMLDLLKELGLEDSTLVLFSSDNGPVHDGVGGSDSAFFESAGPLRGLKGSVYEGGIRVPLIGRWPGRVPAGTTTDLPCYFPDVMPTLMELIGATATLPKDIDGVSFAPTLLGQSAKQVRHEYLVWEFAGYGGQQAVRLGDWKGVRRNLQKGDAPVELYNLKDDIGEQHDVAKQHPDVVRRIEQIMATDRVASKLFPIKALEGR
jgi:arylsulfatase